MLIQPESYLMIQLTLININFNNAKVQYIQATQILFRL